ncbi:hypothetical protein, partial [Sinorhizobium meliloti]|uniref:hypothetical protein n=1 Tax=Rhizobium meliloti TaxID=382 RepID=UPI001AED0D7E
ERDSVNDLLHKLLQIEIEDATCRYFGRKEGSVRERRTYRQVLPRPFLDTTASAPVYLWLGCKWLPLSPLVALR